MPVSDSTFIKDMLRFTERSLSWCAKESEKETMRISEAVDLIYADLKKRSNLSNESLSALESFLKERGEISEPTDGHGSGSEKQMKLMMDDLSNAVSNAVGRFRGRARARSAYPARPSRTSRSSRADR